MDAEIIEFIIKWLLRLIPLLIIIASIVKISKGFCEENSSKRNQGMIGVILGVLLFLQSKTIMQILGIETVTEKEKPPFDISAFIPVIVIDVCVIAVIGIGIVTYFIVCNTSRDKDRIKPESNETEESPTTVSMLLKYKTDLRCVCETLLGDVNIEKHSDGSFKNKPAIVKPLLKIKSILDEIYTFIKENPDKEKRLRQFADYYLPTTLKLAETYTELYLKSNKGANIKSTLTKIEAAILKMVVVYERTFDDLFVDKEMDISSDITVMEMMVEYHNFKESIS